MTCCDFERAWNDLIDAEAGGVFERAALAQSELVERERLLRDHAAQCRACAQVNARYQGLRRAIGVWGPPPSPSAGLAERILAEIQTPKPSAWPIYGEIRKERSRREIWVLAASAAASAIVAITIGPLLTRGLRQDGLPVVPHVTGIGPGGGDASRAEVNAEALNHAWAEATEATWDLARSASEPAARISRQMLDAATAPERRQAEPALNTGPGSIAATVSVPSLDSLAPDAAAAGAMLLQVGDRLATGVRPLSNTARHAFGFLLGAPVPKPDVPNNPQAQKGA